MKVYCGHDKKNSLGYDQSVTNLTDLDNFDNGELDCLYIDGVIDERVNYNDRNKCINFLYSKVKVGGSFIISGLDYRWLVFSAYFCDIDCESFNNYISELVSVDSLDGVLLQLKNNNAKIMKKEYNLYNYNIECVRQ